MSIISRTQFGISRAIAASYQNDMVAARKKYVYGWGALIHNNLYLVLKVAIQSLRTLGQFFMLLYGAYQSIKQQDSTPIKQEVKSFGIALVKLTILPAIQAIGICLGSLLQGFGAVYGSEILRDVHQLDVMLEEEDQETASPEFDERGTQTPKAEGKVFYADEEPLHFVPLPRRAPVSSKDPD